MCDGDGEKHEQQPVLGQRLGRWSHVDATVSQTNKTESSAPGFQ